MCDDRAVSEILGYSLVFTLVITSVAFISVGGLAGYQSAENFERQTNSQKAFDVMHNNLEDIYYQGAPSRGTEIDLGETSLTLADPISLNVTLNGTNNEENFTITSRPLVQSLGDGNKLVYEAGAVFQTTRDGGVVRQQPPMLLRNNTAHIIAANISEPAARSVSSGTVLIRAQSQDRFLRYQNTSRQKNVSLTLNITSPRSELWYEYLDNTATFRGDCTLSGDFVSCGPVNLEQGYLVEVRLAFIFDR
ncbi:DUF7289 family protein [Salinibaculum rarum]|uniref:DUF7289 family protein n=1 Tax=Salinibaculum rarum TaxID=3058903 RepID=UPI00265F0315|nr:hypothetical protein [Salinibaculum sp. KK48]